jgi:hypothetical protein
MGGALVAQQGRHHGAAAGFEQRLAQPRLDCRQEARNGGLRLAGAGGAFCDTARLGHSGQLGEVARFTFQWASFFNGLHFSGGFDFQRDSIFIRDSFSYQFGTPIRKKMIHKPFAIRKPDPRRALREALGGWTARPKRPAI